MRSFFHWYRNLNPPVRWLLMFVVAILGLSFLFAPGPRPVDWQEVNFTTLSSSELYFHNMRSYYYRIYDREKAPLILYRLKRVGSGLVSFMIVENRRADEAYIYGEWAESLTQNENLAIYFGSDTIPEKDIQNYNGEDHYRFAARCYRSLLKNEQILIKDGSKIVIQLFNEPKEKRNALTVLEDYFELVKTN